MKYILLFTLLSTPLFSWSADLITVNILDKFKEEHFKNVEGINKITTNNKIVKIWAWVKFSSNSPRIKNEKYYFEWEYDDGNSVVKIENHEDNEEVYTRDRRIDIIDDYTWLVKRIFPENKGVYVFKVKVWDPSSKSLLTLQSSSIHVE